MNGISLTVNPDADSCVWNSHPPTWVGVSQWFPGVFAVWSASSPSRIDRTQLILDIFAQHATTRDASSRWSWRSSSTCCRGSRSAPRSRCRDSPAAAADGDPARRGSRSTRRRTRDRLTRRTRVEEARLATRTEVHVADQMFAPLDPTSQRLRFPREREVIIRDTVRSIPPARDPVRLRTPSPRSCSRSPWCPWSTGPPDEIAARLDRSKVVHGRSVSECCCSFAGVRARLPASRARDAGTGRALRLVSCCSESGQS